MSVRKLTATLILACVVLCGFTSVQAQERAPLADPFEFDPDFRWFEPVSQLDFDDMTPKKRANCGWFGTYDRLHLYGSRPDVDDPNATQSGLDGGWGHRYELGYMLPSNKGWLFTYTENDVDLGFFVRRESLNRFNLTDLGGTGGGQLAPPFGFPTPPGEGNNLGFNFRFTDVTDTLNTFDYRNIEMNKTWRMVPYHYGGILEPLVGFRYMRVDDTNLFQTFSNTQDPIPLVTPLGANAEQLITNQALTANEMIGGQVGFRYFKSKNRYTFSSDFRAFAGGSFQRSKTQTTTQTTVFSGAGAGSDITQFLDASTTPIFTTNDENFFGVDIRGELAYQLTKAVAIRGGFQVIDIFSGVWRGGPQDPARNPVAGGDMDQSLLQAGFTFGVTLNR